MGPAAIRDWSAMPKIELHLHLEGAIPLEALWTLMQRHGGDPRIRTRDQLEQWFTYKDFAHFIEIWTWMNGHIRTYADFEFAGRAVARDLVHQNIIYAEASFSPSDFKRHGLEPQGIAIAIRHGLDSVPGVDVPLIVDFVRDRGPTNASRVLAAVSEVAGESRVIGVGIGGFEASYPAERFADVYRDARESGFKLTAHAGEGCGPQSVWDAIRSLNVDRIGHGIRSIEDPALVEYLVEHRIPLEVCPTSNLRTGVVERWDQHPVARLIDAGVLVTINTDDPAMFHTTLAGEFTMLTERFGLDETRMKQLSFAAVESSWADEETKARVVHHLAEWWATEHLGPASKNADKAG